MENTRRIEVKCCCCCCICCCCCCVACTIAHGAYPWWTDEWSKKQTKNRIFVVVFWLSSQSVNENVHNKFCVWSVSLFALALALALCSVLSARLFPWFTCILNLSHMQFYCFLLLLFFFCYYSPFPVHCEQILFAHNWYDSTLFISGYMGSPVNQVNK